MEKEDFIKNKAREIGFHLCGITKYNVRPEVKKWIYERKEKGIKTEFEQEDIDIRLNPRITFEKCKSIIVVGLSYNHIIKKRPKGKYLGRLSKSSWGIDYHRVMKERIDHLIEELKRDISFDYKSFVDTGPLIDRELAYLSGLGYYGKNSSIINEEYGSFIFIGYIMTDLDLREDEPIESNCGECNLCLKACPTGAIEREYKINPKKCLSYVSQYKGEISPYYMKKMGNRIYGCDTCQLVCPKNKKAKISDLEEFYPDNNLGFINILELLKMSNKEFKSKYGSMAGSWRGRNILKRNGIINLYNYGDDEALEIIKKELESPSELIRNTAKNIIKEIDGN